MSAVSEVELLDPLSCLLKLEKLGLRGPSIIRILSQIRSPSAIFFSKPPFYDESSALGEADEFGTGPTF